MNDVRSKLEPTAYYLLAASAFAGAFSLPSGRALLAFSLVALVLSLACRRKRPVVTPVTWLALAFAVVAVVTTVFGVNPDIGVPRLRKLLWFVAIPVTTMLVSTPARLSGILGAFAAGTGVLAVRTCVGHPLQALAAVRAEKFDTFAAALIDAGSMTDAQRLMVGVVVCLALILVCRAKKRRWVWWGLLLVLQLAALVLNFKRGSWFCTLGVVAAFVGLRTNWRALLLLILVVLLSLFLPPVRSRLATLTEEFQARRGGRLTMWTEVAPVLIRKYPWGVGYRSLTNEMMHNIYWRVEHKRDHLHSNVLQVLVATGWLGLGVYLLWMGWAVSDAAAFWRRTRAGPAVEVTNALALLLVLAGLLANGLVEYNFGDAELVLVYGWVMGCAAAGRLRS